MQQEHIYVGIWSGDSWSVYLVDELAEVQLAGVDVMREVRTTVVTSRAPSLAARQLGVQAARGWHPHYALQVEGHASQGLEMLREHVRRATCRNHA